MKNISKTILQTLTGAAAAATLWVGRAMASGNPASRGVEMVRAEVMPSDLSVVFHNITNTVLLVVGAVSVLMLIWGGLRYIISGGDSKKVTDAKNTILYALIGLIICLLAAGIVHFVINAVGA